MRSNLLILHGAIGSSQQLEPIAERLGEDFRVILYNFTGHGGKPIPDEPFSIRMFGEELKSLIEKSRLAPCNIFGYSMGGYVALYVARHYPGIIGKVFTLGTKFDWNEETSTHEVKLLNPAKIEEKIPAFAKLLAERHAPEDWKRVLEKTAQMMINLGKKSELTYEELEGLENEVTVAVGDKDNMVSISETERAFRHLKNSKMLVMPDTLHPIEKVDDERLVFELKRFIDQN
jgi:pimeloyl-ACP methyl ester carboxylesterase